MKTKKILRLSLGYAIALGFIALGFFILTNSESLLGQSIGLLNIILFVGFMIWSVYKLTKSSKVKL